MRLIDCLVSLGTACTSEGKSPGRKTPIRQLPAVAHWVVCALYPSQSTLCPTVSAKFQRVMTHECPRCPELERLAASPAWSASPTPGLSVSATFILPTSITASMATHGMIRSEYASVRIAWSVRRACEEKSRQTPSGPCCCLGIRVNFECASF